MSDDVIIASALCILDAAGVEYMATYQGKTFHNLDKDNKGKVEKPFRSMQNRSNTAIIDRDKWMTFREGAYAQMKAMEINDELVFINETHNNLSNFRSAVSGVMHKAHGRGSYITQGNPKTKEVKIIRLR